MPTCQHCDQEVTAVNGLLSTDSGEADCPARLALHEVAGDVLLEIFLFMSSPVAIPCTQLEAIRNAEAIRIAKGTDRPMLKFAVDTGKIVYIDANYVHRIQITPDQLTERR